MIHPSGETAVLKKGCLASVTPRKESDNQPARLWVKLYMLIHCICSFVQGNSAATSGKVNQSLLDHLVKHRIDTYVCDSAYHAAKGLPSFA